MKALISQYQMIAPLDLKEALHEISLDPLNTGAFAGGTDLMVLFEMGKLTQKKWVSLDRIDELKKINLTDQEMKLGSMTNFNRIALDKNISKHWPLLSNAAQNSAAKAIRYRATLGGNLANASPAADLPPALLAYDAQVCLAEIKDNQIVFQSVPIKDFFIGYKKTALKEGQIIYSVDLKKPDPNAIKIDYYKKVGTRQAQAISKIAFAAHSEVKNDKISKMSMAWASVGPVPMQLLEVQQKFIGTSKNELLSVAKQVAEDLRKNLCPIDDIRSTSKFRKKVILNLFNDWVEHVSNCSWK